MFTKRTPGLAELRKRLKDEVNKTGHIRNIDGRFFPCDDPHFALAFILQGYEQTIMKMAMVKTRDYLKSMGNHFRGAIVAWVHDEFQMEIEDLLAPPEYHITVSPDKVLTRWPEIVGQKVVGFIEEVGRELQLKCFLTGEAKQGKSWLDSH